MHPLAHWQRPAARCQAGQALVEFALVLPVVLLIMLAIISFGLIFTYQNTLNHAAREGARAGAVCKSDAEIEQIVREQLRLLPQPETVTVRISQTDAAGNSMGAGSRARGGRLTVSLGYVANVAPIPGVLSARRPLKADATFRMESDSPAP